MITLSPEDALRLNVLLANAIQAIRIDDYKMVVYGLAEQNEAKIQLHPTCRSDLYLKQIREVIAGHIFDSPGGYPVYLRHWTRMGQARDDSLEQLLMLGEPEAVVAVANAAGLTPELAKRAWWAMPDSQNARSMLSNSAVVRSDIGQELAQYLVDYLPFEEEPNHLIESIRLVLQADLISDETKQAIWQKGKNKTSYLVGFLLTLPDNLPETSHAHSQCDVFQTKLSGIKDNPITRQLMRVLSANGQAFIHTCERVLRKPANQEVVTHLFDAIAHYFVSILPTNWQAMSMEQLLDTSQQTCEQQEDLVKLFTLAPETKPFVHAMLILSGLSYDVLNPIFSTTTAIGSLMRKKLQPVSTPVLAQLALLKK